MDKNVQVTMFRCEWCGKPLTEKLGGRRMRSDRKYCNSVCRAQQANWLKRAEKLTVKLCKDMHELGAYLDHRTSIDAATRDFAEVLKAWRFETVGRGIRIKAVDRE